MKDINVIANRCIEQLETIGIYPPTIESFTVNTRAKKRWGQCRRRGGKYYINISERLLADELPDFPVMNTTIHEILHTMPNAMNHGDEWSRLAEQVNEKLGFNISRCSDYREFGLGGYSPTTDIKYVFQCTGCGGKVYRRRKSKFTENSANYRCSKCGGKFERIKFERIERGDTEMKKEKYYIKRLDGFHEIEGYLTDIGGVKFGIHRRTDKDGTPIGGWTGTHIDTGLAVHRGDKRADVVDFINENIEKLKAHFDDEIAKESARELYAFLNGENDAPVSKTGVDESEVDTDEKSVTKCDIDAETIKADLETLDDRGTWEKRLEYFIACSMKYHGTDVWDKFVDAYKNDYELTKNIHVGMNGKTMVAETRETADEMVNLVNTLATCKGLTTEIVGRFIWTGGTQKPYAKVLKSLGFTYMGNKKKWCKSYKGYVRYGRKKQYSYARIKSMYGATTDETA